MKHWLRKIEQSNYKQPIIWGTGTALAFGILSLKSSSEKKAKKIVKEAQKYVGQREITQNQGFYDATFEQKMKNAGWYRGAKWCEFFVRMVVLNAIGFDLSYPCLSARLSRYGSAVGTWVNFKKHQDCGITTTMPTVGAIAVWKKPNSESSTYPYGQGHIEIVERLVPGGFVAIGGNEGDAVTRVQHNSIHYKGMDLLGFIKIR